MSDEENLKTILSYKAELLPKIEKTKEPQQQSEAPQKEI